MKSQSYISLLVLLLFFLPKQLEAQSEYLTYIVRDTIPVNLDNNYTVSQPTIIPFTETVVVGDSLLTKKDYKFSYDKGTFTLSDSLPYSIYDTLVVTYQALNLGLLKVYKRRDLVIRSI